MCFFCWLWLSVFETMFILKDGKTHLRRVTLIGWCKYCDVGIPETILSAQHSVVPDDKVSSVLCFNLKVDKCHKHGYIYSFNLWAN